MEEDACRLLFIYKRKKNKNKNLTVCVWCGLSSCLNELLSYSNRVVCTIDLCDSEENTSAEALPSRGINNTASSKLGGHSLSTENLSVAHANR